MTTAHEVEMRSIIERYAFERRWIQVSRKWRRWAKREYRRRERRYCKQVAREEL